MPTQIHKRKSSKDSEENGNIISTTDQPPVVKLDSPPSRYRTQSTPHNYGHSRSASLANGFPPSAGPYRTTFAPSPLNGNGPASASPYRTSFGSQMQPPPSLNGHHRTRSISTPFTPTSPSPLASSFNPSQTQPLNGLPVPSTSPTTSNSFRFPSMNSSQSSQDSIETKPSRRHTRIHSRNLSVFFPRPGSLPHSTISEDGSQEVELPVDEEAPLVPAASPSVNISGHRRGHQPVTPLGQGFTFGSKPPPGATTDEYLTGPASATSRRGHHHKHSLSHNFFSFLEPGSTEPLPSPAAELHTQPAPVPQSPWGPVSAFPESAPATGQSGFKLPPVPRDGQVHLLDEPQQITMGSLTASLGQFTLGAWLWVVGQQVGSLSCTGVGYWVVFDSFGVALSRVVPAWLASTSKLNVSEKERLAIRRPYGNGRLKTVLLFAQTVYLMFSSVYVCKETVEHVLLSAGGGEGHHHHHGDENMDIGIDFPIFMIFITFISLFSTAFVYNNHSKLVDISGNRIPSPSSILRSIWSPSRHTHELPPTTPLGLLFSNPFVASPLFFCTSVLVVALVLPPSQHRLADLILASIIAILTFKVAYRSSVVLGTVLLQTSPPRGLASGKMEAFLRTMRELERHPQVLHLPAPHIWQLSPSSTDASKLGSKNSPTESLVVTLELHVREDLGDDDVLKLTKWAWERCVSALGSKEYNEMGETGGPEVTIGVVRG
ncbi:hypothetical protein CVT24_011250 [Panaeolus cyanescens]|uniref:Uncharacterized protein n=1 Tax=Panaeolus cyanescens TaxID=181874 RepID=A0A409VI36_9AGAR|nr:hypothetical protein CVT24_011250 [Panaeolus cyanescens]